jgi:hypothetical protein
MPQCDKAVSRSLQPNSLHYGLLDGVRILFCDKQMVAKTREPNYIKKTTEELAVIIKNEAVMFNKDRITELRLMILLANMPQSNSTNK